MIGRLIPQQIDTLLNSQMIGRLGCSSDNIPYVVPITYAYDGKYIYGHTIEGMKINMMRVNPNVCFEVDDIDNLANWRSAILRGVYEELDGKESEHAMQLILNKVQPFTTSETLRPQHSMQLPRSRSGTDLKTVVFRINIVDRSGRFEKT